MIASQKLADSIKLALAFALHLLEARGLEQLCRTTARAGGEHRHETTGREEHAHRAQLLSSRARAVKPRATYSRQLARADSARRDAAAGGGTTMRRQP